MRGREPYSEETEQIKIFRKYFGENLKRMRISYECTQEKFAEICNIERAYYGKIERGESAPTIDCCYLIASSLGLEVKDLFENLPE